MSTLLATVLLLLPMSEAGESEGGGLGLAIAIGVGALTLLFASVFALMAFGKGRDHS